MGKLRHRKVKSLAQAVMIGKVGAGIGTGLQSLCSSLSGKAVAVVGSSLVTGAQEAGPSVGYHEVGH